MWTDRQQRLPESRYPGPGETVAHPGPGIEGDEVLLFDVVHRPLAVGGAINSGVVQDHDFAIFGEADIKFNRLGPEANGFIKCRHRVLWSVRGRSREHG